MINLLIMTSFLVCATVCVCVCMCARPQVTGECLQDEAEVRLLSCIKSPSSLSL